MTQQILSERQQRAKALVRELEKLDGVVCVSPLPLDDGKRLRLQVLERERNNIVQTLRDWGWQPIPCGVLPRITPMGVIPAAIWEIDLPRPQPVVEDRTIRGEIAERQKTSAEIEGIKKYLGLK